MISKFLSKLKSILFKSAVSADTPLKKEKKATKSAKTAKTKTKTKSVNSKKNIETLTTLPGVGAKSAKALLCMRLDLKQKKQLLPLMKKIFLLYQELV